jgi:hypothetical protein
MCVLFFFPFYQQSSSESAANQQPLQKFYIVFYNKIIPGTLILFPQSYFFITCFLNFK